MALQIANEISGRKNMNRLKLKATILQEQLNNYKEDFQSFLSNLRAISDKNTETDIKHNLDIKLCDFTGDCNLVIS